MKLLKDLDLENLVFIDIETVNAVKQLEPNTALWDSWSYKNKYGRDPLNAPDVVKSFTDQAALYPEFGKIVCITIGKIKDDVIKLRSYVGDDEKTLLTNFTKALSNLIASNKRTKLVGHAILGFDIPWLMRRCIVNQVEIPSLLDLAGLKPWNCADIIIDTMELWKGTAFNGGSLIAIAVALGLHNPKDELAGYQTSEVYYNDPENGLKRIQQYCEKDVTTVANIVRMCRYEPIVIAENGEIKVDKTGILTRTFNTGNLIKDDERTLTTSYNSLNGGEKAIAQEIIQVVNKSK